MIGIVLLILPTLSIFHWMCRLLIWIGLGPWTRIGLEIFAAKETAGLESERDVKFGKIDLKFKMIGKEARRKGEEALKMKSMRMYRFGQHIAKVPRLNYARHYDYPLPGSEAKPVSVGICPNMKPNNIIESQCLQGTMIPLTEEDVKHLEKDASLANRSNSHSNERDITQESHDECPLMPNFKNGIKQLTPIPDDSAEASEESSLNEFISFDYDDIKDELCLLQKSSTSSTRSTGTYNSGADEVGIEVQYHELSGAILIHENSADDDQNVEMEIPHIMHLDGVKSQ